MLDLSAYKQLYIKTSIENLSELKNSLASLYSQPENIELAVLAHRAAHTIAGKALMMTDVKTSTVAKEMENILFPIRDGKTKLTPETMQMLAKLLEDLSNAIQTSVAAAPAGPAIAPVASPGPMRILVMEDDVFFQKFYSTKLAEQGFQVSVAGDGEEGLQMLPQVNPNLILLDIIMPKKDGFEVLKTLAANKNTIPIIVFSSLGQETDIEKAKSLGAADYINKSFYDFDILLSKIYSFIKK